MSSVIDLLGRILLATKSACLAHRIDYWLVAAEPLTLGFGLDLRNQKDRHQSAAEQFAVLCLPRISFHLAGRSDCRKGLSLVAVSDPSGLLELRKDHPDLWSTIQKDLRLEELKL